MRRAREATVEWLKVEPDHERAKKNLQYYDSQVSRTIAPLVLLCVPTNARCSRRAFVHSQSFHAVMLLHI